MDLSLVLQFFVFKAEITRISLCYCQNNEFKTSYCVKWKCGIENFI